MVHAPFHVAIPYPNNQESAGGHISILASVKHHPAFLPAVRLGKHLRITVPVVAIKLNNHAAPWDKSVYTEFATNEKLALMGNIHAIKHGVSGSFKGIWVSLALLDVHLKKHFPTLGIFITASYAAIGRVRDGFAGRGPQKPISAHLAGVAVFVSALVRVVTRRGAKPGARPSLGCIEHHSAMLANLIPACAAAWSVSGSIAFQGTEGLAWARTLSDGRSASFAGEAADLVHRRHSTTPNPMPTLFDLMMCEAA